MHKQSLIHKKDVGIIQRIGKRPIPHSVDDRIGNLINGTVNIIFSKLFIKIECGDNSLYQRVMRVYLASIDKSIYKYGDINILASTVGTRPNGKYVFTIKGSSYSNIIRISPRGWMYYSTVSVQKEIEHSNAAKNSNNVTVYLFGPDRFSNKKKFIKLIKNMDIIDDKLDVRLDTVMYGERKDTFTIMRFDMDDKGFRTCDFSLSQIQFQKLDAIYLNKKCMDTIAIICKQNKAISDIYNKFHKNDRKTILLEGVPGTGKTSVAMALAYKLNKKLIIFDPTVPRNAFDEQIRLLFSGFSKYNDSVILIEEVDQLFTTRDEKDINIEDALMTSRSDSLYKANQLMQALSGTMSGLAKCSGQMIIVTTNFVDKLDKAFIRDGRFDYKLTVSNLPKEHAMKMVEEKFELPFDVIEPSLIKDENGDYNPANIENMCIQHLIQNT